VDLGVDRIADHLHRPVAKCHVKAVRVGAAKPPGSIQTCVKPGVSGSGAALVQRERSELSPKPRSRCRSVLACAIPVGHDVLLTRQIRIARAVGDVGHLDEAANMDYPRGRWAMFLNVVRALAVICQGGFSTSAILAGPDSMLSGM